MPKQTGMLVLLIAMAFCIAPGCDQGVLGKVSGTVTLDGEPLPDAMVEFIPVSGDGGASFGRTDDKGNYYLMFSRTAKGAALGENKVRITTHDVLDDGGRDSWVVEKVPTKYNSQTELLFKVEPGSNTASFALSTADGTIGQPIQGSD